VVCVGLNYVRHVAETGADLPSEPVLFLKAPDTVIGPHDQVLVPRTSERTDDEVELAVVIGRTARYLATSGDAADAIAGYAISNDVSERTFQLEGGYLRAGDTMRLEIERLGTQQQTLGSA
jgi:2-keto-4-pentenoate hydratase/2-oxohepta-3-ene-1,7-dioic acid hydratase in catechol pathway